LRKFVIPLGLVLLNFVLKILFLDSRSVWGDEAFSIFHAQMDIPAIIHQLSHGNNPPLFEIILHYWIRVFGISPFSVRFLPLVFCSVTPVFIYTIGLRFFNLRVGILAALIYTFSIYHILFAHEARVYGLFTLLTTVSMYCFFEVIRGERTRIFLILLALSNILLAYSHFLGFFIPAIQLMSCILFKELRKDKLLPICGAILILILAYIPYLNILISRLHISAAHGTWLRPVGIEETYNVLWSFSNQPLLAVLFLCILLAGFYTLIIRREAIPVYTKIIALWFLLPFVLMFLISCRYFSFNIPVFQGRYLTFTSIGFYLLVAVLLDHISGLRIYRLIVLPIPAIVMLATCRLDPDINLHVSDAVRKVRELKTKNTVVYICPAYYSANFAYYYDRRYFAQYDNDSVYRKLDSCLAGENIFAIYHAAEIDTAISYAADRIVYYDVAASSLVPDNGIEALLSSRYFRTQHFDYPMFYSVSVFEKK
jgi:uncharacterized membrane protein